MCSPTPSIENDDYCPDLTDRLQAPASPKGQSISDGRPQYSTLPSAKRKKKTKLRQSQLSININPEEIKEVDEQIISERPIIKTPRRFQCDQNQAYETWKNNQSDALELAASQTFLRAKDQVKEYVTDLLNYDMGEQIEGPLEDYLKFNFENNAEDCLPFAFGENDNDQSLDKFVQKSSTRKTSGHTLPWRKDSNLTNSELEERNNFFYIKNSLVVLEK